MKPEQSPPPHDANEEIAALIETLHLTGQRLEELTAGEVDAVADRDGRTFLLQHAQEQLRHSEATKQAAILNALPAHIALLDTQGFIVSVNEAWRRFARENALLSPDYGLGLDYLRICDAARGDDADAARQVAAGIRSVLAGAAGSFSLEYPCHSPTQQRWFMVTVTPLAEDHPNGVVVMHLNITASKLAENALRESKEEFQTLAEAMPQIVWITRADGWNIYFNQRWMDYTGLTLEESLGHGWNKPFHPDDQQHAWDAWQKAIATKDIYSIESRLRRADGMHRWWLVRGVPLLGADGKILKWFGTCTDIHDLKTAEVALQKTKLQLSEALKIAKIGYWEYEVSKDEFIFSDQYYLLHKMTAAEAGGYRMSSADFAARFVHSEDAAVVGQNIQLALEARDPDYFVKTEVRILSGDGEVIWVEVRFRTQNDMQGNAIRLIGVNQDITDRKQAELKLLESERRFTDLLGNVEMISMMLDREGQITYCNEYLLRLTGWRHEEVIGQNWFELFIPPEVGDFKSDFFASLLADSPDALHHENEILMRSGERRLIRWNNTVLRSGGGEVIGTASIGEDITARKFAEKALVKLQRQSALILESVEEGIYGIDLEGRISFQNPTAAKLLGYGIDELIGRPAHATVHHTRVDGTPYPPAECPIHITMLDGVVRRIGDEVFWRKDGSRLQVEYTTAPIRNEQNAIVGEVVAFRDVTERKRAEQALRESERSYTESKADAAEVRDIAARLQAILDTVGDGVITIDEFGKVETFNPAAERIFGYAADAIVGRNIKMLMPEPYHSQHDAYLEHYRNTGEAHVIDIGREVMGQRQDGSTFPLELAVSEMLLGGVCHYTGVVRDITERQTTERAAADARIEAERANAAKDIFLANMSHEIRTPMNGVVGMIEVLQQSSLNGPQMEMANVIRDSAFALLAVINDILDFSKIAAGKLEIERVPMDVAEVVEKACEIMDRMAQKNEVALTLFTDPAIPAEVMGDPGRLRQILINLTSNAIKFSSGKQQTGRVSVRVRVANRNTERVMLEFQVADNGVGIDEATLARIFTPFTQGDVTTTRNYGGTGLGLAISRQLANMMDGEISVQSEPDKGSLFTARIPFALLAAGDNAERTLPGESDRDLQSVAGLSCLVVGAPEGIAGDLAAYLAYGEAVVERTADPAAAKRWITRQSSGRPIVVIDTSAASPALDELRATARAHTKTHPESDTRFVVIRRGLHRGLRVDGAHLVSVDGNVLTRRALLNAVAIAAGRAQAPSQKTLPDDVKASRAPVSGAALRRLSSRILVAEDNEINQSVILHQLALLGYAAEVADDGREALARWHQGNYALLLTDLRMPHMDGYELTAAIRRTEGDDRHLQHLPIVALTANALKSEERRCKEAGMDDYLTKPVLLDRLQAMLEKWLPIPGQGEVADASVAAPPASQHFAVLDRAVLPQQIGNDPALIARFFRDYQRSAQTAADEIRAAIALGDWKTASDGAHKLKSSSRAVGALALGEVCQQLEQAGKDGNADNMQALATEVENALAAVLDAMNQERSLIVVSPNILLVDDEAFQLQLLSRQLAILGRDQVHACTSGQQALALLEEQPMLDVPPGEQLIFLDLNMPGMDGVEFIRRLVDIPYTGALVLVSGEDARILETAERLARAHRLRVLGHLSKPVQSENLKTLLERWRGAAPEASAKVAKRYGAEEVRRAIVGGELVNYYQPKVDMASGALSGVEALVRWRHPADGLVLPDDFIGVAEENGLIDELTRVVLIAALEQSRRWRDEGLMLRVAVNVSMHNLARLEFADFVFGEVVRCGVAAENLILEVTESRLMTNILAPLDILTRLRLKRIGLSIDDFGTGHSSLSQLRDIPFDELKIDRSFVHGAGMDNTRRAIFAASLGMARQLGMKTVAEGVEDRADWNFLRQQGCDLAQGYFIARPMPAGELRAWLADWEARHPELLPE